MVAIFSHGCTLLARLEVGTLKSFALMKTEQNPSINALQWQNKNNNNKFSPSGVP